MKKTLKILFVIILVLVFLIAVLFVWARYVEPNLLITKKVDIKSTIQTPQAKIVLFSDTHFGKYYNVKNIEKIVNKINKQNPDVVIFSGDLMDNFARDSEILDKDYLSQQLKKINSKYGKFAVWGNHDYGGGASRVYEDIMENGGFSILKNDIMQIDNLNLAIYGLDSTMLGNPTLNFKTKPSSETFNIFVSHEGDVVEDVQNDNINLFLAGHTHGGQVYVPFLTQEMLPPYGKQYRKGEYDVKTNAEKTFDSKLFVTSGIGLTQIPFRFLNTPEICVININQK